MTTMMRIAFIGHRFPCPADSCPSTRRPRRVRLHHLRVMAAAMFDFDRRGDRTEGPHNRGAVAAICHAPWTLIEAGVVSGRTLTSWPSLRTDLTNAGAHWVDEEVVRDGGLVTSRNPGDLPAFCSTLVKAFA